MLEIVGDSDVRYNRNVSTIKCRLCGSNKTRLRNDNSPIWVKDKNSRREWMSSFICYDCAYGNDKCCYRCGSDNDRYVDKYYDNKGVWTGKYICDYCRKKDISEYRNKRIRLRISEGTGSVCDTMISKILEIPVCSIYAGDTKLPFNLIHGYYGIVGTKISNMRRGKWDFRSNGRISADTYFHIGFDKNYKNIEIVYVIPSEDLANSNGRVCLYRNTMKYLKYKIDNTIFNDIYHSRNRSVDKESTIKKS